MQLIHFVIFIYCSLAASAPVLDTESSTTRYNVGASIALLRLGDPDTCKFEYECPDSNKPYCTHCAGHGPNDAGWCSNLNNSPENNPCADKFYSEYCGTRYCLNGAEVIQTDDIETEESVYEAPTTAFESADEQHAMQLNSDRDLSEASVPEVYEDYREIDFD